MVLSTRNAGFGRNTSEPCRPALGTTVPSMGPISRRAAPNRIAARGSGRGDSPKIVTVVGKTRRQLQTETPMSFGCRYRVLEIVGVAVALSSQIEPCLRILMHEERRRKRTDANGDRRDSNSVRFHAFQAYLPAADEMVTPCREDSSSPTRCSNPSGKEEIRPPASSHEETSEVSSAAQFQSTRLKIASASNFGLGLCQKYSRHVKNAAKQDGGIDGRHFRIPDSFACVEVRPMVEKSPVIGHGFPEKGESGQHARAMSGWRGESSFVTDAKARSVRNPSMQYSLPNRCSPIARSNGRGSGPSCCLPVPRSRGSELFQARRAVRYRMVIEQTDRRTPPRLPPAPAEPPLTNRIHALTPAGKARCSRTAVPLP